MTNYGLNYQLRTYLKIDGNDMPVSINDWHDLAMKKLDNGPWGYLEGSAGSNDTEKNNERSFLKYRIRPRYLRDVSNIDMSIRLFGKRFETPFILGPIGVTSIIHNDGDIAIAKAAENLGMPFALSTVSSYSIEDVAKAAPNAERWFQLYPGRDKNIMKSMIRRAEKSGYSAIIVTVDTTMLGWRETDLKNAYLPFLLGYGIANYITDPEFNARLDKSPEEDMKAAIEEFLSIYVNPGFTWDDFSEIRSWTRLPLIIKGITHIDDVKKAFDYNADAVVISNHGGRQVDGAISSIDALHELSLNDINGTILFDSGIRHAADAFKAIALGASAVLIGRPYIYALAVAGQAGIERYMDQLRSEFNLEMALSGYGSLSELNRETIYVQK
ncbi:alpha-hydroxy-acid oxidizing protein [Picrophilus oshimae]|uniref:Lactate 2-monooxygenase n=1 Tax=Picrophilus torridus (strain ATCC 700027 / DSM 9790 / JCM 10055 / NBRC 100828 / KAW 2/3) TaxID=1122961 RepID=A0A8G2FXD4_PICTO|nr:alpha-hydroxy-acid oxidizing protein [Picrophilus oshimae]SMD31224.1 lactate 2-monooxygenase [Picrophilus oshimae DSM 9789]